MDEDLEPVDDDVVDATPDGGAGDPAEPVARADEDGEPASPSAPSIDWDNLPPEAEARLAGMSQEQTIALLERLGVVSFDTPQAEGPPAPDPLSDTYAQDLERWFEAKIAAQNAPLAEYVQAEQAARTDAYIGDALSEAAKAASLADADTGLLRAVAGQFATRPEFARLGATEEGVKATAKAAAEWLANERKTAGESAVLNYRKQIGEIQDTPAEPSAGGGGALGIESKPKTYDEILEHHLGSLT